MGKKKKKSRRKIKLSKYAKLKSGKDSRVDKNLEKIKQIEFPLYEWKDEKNKEVKQDGI